MKPACKNCDFWRHATGRNAAGAAVRAAPCLFSVDVDAIPIPESITRAYDFGSVKACLENHKGRHMEPNDGATCRTFKERTK